MNPQARGRTLLLARLVMVAAATLGLLAPGPASSAQGAGRGELRLVTQTPLVPADGTFTVQLDPGSLDIEGHEVVVTVYRIVEEITELGAEPTQADTLNRLELGPAEAMATATTGELRVDIPIRGGEPFDDAQRVRLPDAGVYPVRIEVRNGESQPVASALTTLIRLPAPEAEPVPTLPVALMLTVPGPSPVADGLTVQAATELLVEHPSVPLTLALGDGLLARLSADLPATTALVEALAGRPVLVGTEPALDPSALAAIDQGPLFGSQHGATVATVERLGFARDPSMTAIDATLTAAGASVLHSLGITVAVDRSQTATDTDTDTGTIATGTGPVHVVGTGTGPTGNAWLYDTLARLVLSRQAGSAGELLDIPPGTDPATVSTLLGLLSDLSDGGSLLTAVPLAELAPVLATEPMEPAGQPVRDLGPVAESVAVTLADLAVYESFYVDGSNSPASYRALLTNAISLDAGNGPGVSTFDTVTVLDSIRQQMADELTVVSLPSDQSVTLAARSAIIPLTITNAADGQRQVQLQFRSDKFLVAEDGQVITIGPGTSPIDVRIDARSLGVSPLDVTILTADGEHELATTQFEIRSTAVPGLGLLISAVGLALLGAWWYGHFQRKRSPQNEAQRSQAVACNP